MSVSSVIILCPSGPRLSISTTPTRTLMSIIEEVLKKRGLSEEDPSCYSLRHQGAVLDSSLSIRLTTLTNKATLELIKASSSPRTLFVPVIFQLEDGSRLPPTSEATPASTLLQALFLAGVAVDPARGEPSILYMRTETTGVDALQSTTLRSLGIQTTDKVLLRFFYKESSAPSIRTSGDALLQKKKEESVMSKMFNFVKDSTTATSSTASSTASSRCEPSKSNESSLFSKASKILLPSSAPQSGTSNDSKKRNKTTQALLDKMKSGQRLEDEKASQSNLPDPIIHFLDDQESILAFDASSSPRSEQFKDIDSSFFEHGVSDLQLLQDSNKRATLEDAPLLTAKMRAAQEESSSLNLLRRYKRSVIRVQFPNRLVLQVVLLSGETVGTLKEKVKGYLRDPSIPFDLFVSPPRRVLRPEDTLLKAELVPATCVHFSSLGGPNDLKEEVLSQLSNFTGANTSCGGTKRKGVVDEDASPTVSTSSNSTTTSANADKSSGVVPKWFKMGGK